MTGQPSADRASEFLDPFVALPSGRILLDPEPVDGAAIAAGSPSTASRALLKVSSAEIGIWEMTEGGMFDTEVDEVFVVLSGRAIVTLLDDSELRTIVLDPGTVCRLTAGMRTRWDVTETLRKVYIVGVATGPSGPDSV